MLRGVSALILCLISVVLAANPSHLLKGLPRQPRVSFKQYAGYITFNSSAQRSLFYWFYEADHPNSSSLPLALWLTGGPGCSSVGAGALMEIGPFRVNSSGTGLVHNPRTWNKAANLLFLESPHGTGFSSSKTVSDETPHYNDDETSSDSLHFLQGWFSQFPEYSKNDFYLLGESYAGHYVPTLAAKILAHNALGKSAINLKGFALGNPWTDAYHDNKGDTDFFHSHSVIPDELYDELNSNCNFSTLRPIDSGSENSRCRVAGDAITELLKGVSHYNIYKPSCESSQSTSFLHSKRLISAYNPCEDVVSQYLNLPDVQAALNVSVRYSLCNSQTFEFYQSSDILSSMLPIYKQLLDAKLKIWIYSGDLDGVVATLSTRNWINALNLTTQTPWRSWSYKERVGGWTQAYAGLTFVTVREAGHMVPADRPKESLFIFEHFLSGKPLPSFYTASS